MVNHQTLGAADRAAHLSPEDLDTLRENLREQLLFRREQLRALAAERTAVPTAGPTPRGAAARAEVRGRIEASARMVVTDVRAALRRMAEGGYGVCGLCRRPVDREHLMVVPQARYCARCRQVREAGR
ncbi:hypothetical protein AB0E75_09940 [Streptomyces griseoviridis]|uniref:TraR/DksA family transcriptional regulator n=1 Tax=Streptomyces griseoviridis TaxID=45398 RepID=UPI001677630B|nr:hypothetical protein [Streptomyces niveoruber]